MIFLNDIWDAYLLLHLHGIGPTRLIFSEFFSEFFGKRIYFKPENLQIAGSFKIRGAYLKLFRLLQEGFNGKVICVSAGNHAQGVAWAGKELGFEVTVVMPKFAPAIKIQGVKALGARIVLYGKTLEDAYFEAERISFEERSILIHPYDDETIITGQGTIGLEILQELPCPGSVIIPVGGGGLAAGISSALKKSLNGDIRIIGVRSRSKIADGIFIKKIGQAPMVLMKRYIDRMVLVTRKDIASAILMLMEKSKLVAEGAGVAGLAALLSHKIKIEDLPEPIVVILSGGNIDINLIEKIIKKQASREACSFLI